MGTESVVAHPVALATGKAHKLPMVQVAFRRYDRLECLDPGILSQSKAALERKPFSALLPEEFKQALRDFPASRQIEKKGWGKPKLATNQWIYVFKSRGGGAVSLDSEFQVTASGETQTAKYVSWTTESRSKWNKQYPRPATLSRDKVFLSTVDPLFVLMSENQLPYARIAFYSSAKGGAALKERAMEIPVGALAQSSETPVIIDLVDGKAVVTAAEAESTKARNAFLEYSADQTRSGKVYLANFLWELSKTEKNVGKWVRMSEIVRFREDIETELRKRAGKAEAMEAFFYAFKLHGLFKEMREDIFGSDLKEMEAAETDWLCKEAAWLGNAPGSQYGLAYLEEAAQEDTWFSRIFVGTEGLVVKKTLIGLKESELADLLNRFLIGRVLWRLKSLNLGQQIEVVEKISSVQVQIIHEIEIIVKRLQISVVQFGKYQGTFLKAQAYQARKITRIEYKIDVLESTLVSLPTAQWKTAVEGMSKVCQGIVLAIEIGNLFASARTLAASNGKIDAAWNAIDVADSLCDNIGAIGNIAEKSLGKYWTLVLKKISLVGSLLDFALYTRKVFLNLDKGRYGLAAAYTVMSLSAIALAAGTVFTMEIGTLATLGFAGGPWTMIGALLLMAGTILVYIFTESEIEEWARECLWGTRGSASSTPKQLGEQITGLHELLSKFDAECFITAVPIPGTDRWMGDGSIQSDYEYFLVLKIEANFFLEKISKFRVNLGATDIKGIGSYDNITIVPKEQEFFLPDTVTRTHKTAKSKSVFSRWWKLNDQFARTRADSGRYEYDLKVRLDFNGDGNDLFPSQKPLEKSGDCEFKGLYLTGLRG